jgi:hypothetical protein
MKTDFHRRFSMNLFMILLFILNAYDLSQFPSWALFMRLNFLAFSIQVYQIFYDSFSFFFFVFRHCLWTENELTAVEIIFCFFTSRAKRK